MWYFLVPPSKLHNTCSLEKSGTVATYAMIAVPILQTKYLALIASASKNFKVFPETPVNPLPIPLVYIPYSGLISWGKKISRFSRILEILTTKISRQWNLSGEMMLTPENIST